LNVSVVPAAGTFTVEFSTATIDVSKESDSVSVATITPAVTETRRVWRTDELARARNDVSAAHSVASQAVAPTPVTDESHAAPSCAPNIVTDTPPVAAWFCRWDTLIELWSALYAAVILPVRRAAVTETLSVPRPEAAVLHNTNVSDVHLVASTAVAPTRFRVLYAYSPKFKPWTVLLNADGAKTGAFWLETFRTSDIMDAVSVVNILVPVDLNLAIVNDTLAVVVEDAIA
jgi:hypothetical protein